MSTAEIIALYGLALIAGAVDASVGAGGLIQIPALLLLLPDSDVAAILGTHKFASIFGTAVAVHQYHRAGAGGLTVDSLLPFVVVAAVVGAFLGAKTASSMPSQYVKVALLVFLVAAAVYVFLKRDLGLSDASKHRSRPSWWRVGLSLGLGFYDGAIGLGAGSIFLLAFVSLWGYDFVSAAAAARTMNLATNLSATATFAFSGDILYMVALPLALLNVIGAVAGTRLATAKGSKVVRMIFRVVVIALILKLMHEQLHVWLFG